MTAPQAAPRNPHDLCTWRPESACADCAAAGRLDCRFSWRELAYFLAIFLPSMLPAAIGMVQGGYGGWLLGWFGYAMFFFNGWETYILCRHCPYYAEKGLTLHCISNYGSLKLWPYNPGPMSRVEKAQFLVGAGLLMLFPFPFLAAAGQWTMLLLTAVGVVAFAWSTRKAKCARCVNFSCPLNTVPRPVVDAYLRRNPVMRAAWEAAGWDPGDEPSNQRR